MKTASKWTDGNRKNCMKQKYCGLSINAYKQNEIVLASEREEKRKKKTDR